MNFVFHVREREKKFLIGLKNVASRLPPHDELKKVRRSQTIMLVESESPPDSNDAKVKHVNAACAFEIQMMKTPIKKSLSDEMDSKILSVVKNKDEKVKTVRTPLTLRQFKQKQRVALENSGKSNEVVVEILLKGNEARPLPLASENSENGVSSSFAVQHDPALKLSAQVFEVSNSFSNISSNQSFMPFPKDVDLGQKIDIVKNTCEKVFGRVDFERVYRDLRDISDADPNGKIDDRKVVLVLRPYLSKSLFAYLRYICLLICLENEYFHQLPISL